MVGHVRASTYILSVLAKASYEVRLRKFVPAILNTSNSLSTLEKHLIGSQPTGSSKPSRRKGLRWCRCWTAIPMNNSRRPGTQALMPPGRVNLPGAMRTESPIT